MNENENLVTEQVAENVEQTTEESPKTILLLFLVASKKIIAAMAYRGVK